MSDLARSRLANFKGGPKAAQDLRRKRAEQSIELRKAARDSQLQKRRNLRANDDEPLSPTSASDTENQIETTNNVLPSIEDIVKALNSYNRQDQLFGARAARKTLSRELNPPIDSMINAGCVPKLVEMLNYDDCGDLQFEAAWALTNIASGNSQQTSIVIEYNAIEPLIRLVSSPNPAICEQSLWALGNIAGEGAQERDFVIKKGLIRPLVRKLEAEGDPTTVPPQPTSSFVRTAVWAMSNLCRNKNPLVDFRDVRECLPVIVKLLHSQDKDVLADTCWALSYLTDGPDDRIEAVQQFDILPPLIPLLGHPNYSVQTPALRAVGNMLTGSNDQTQLVLEAGPLPLLRNLLSSPRAAIVKEAAWAACNILAGTEKQRDMFIAAELMIPLVKVLNHSELKCQREAAYAISNLALEGSLPQLGSLLHAGALKPYIALLAGPDVKTTMVVLDGLSSLLKQAEAHGELDALCLSIEEDGGLDKLEALQQHENEEIYKKTLHILDTYFSEDEPKDEAIVPQEVNGEFQFGTGAGHIGGF
ncbi:importin subunit alpha-1-like [Arctopsyche grandis]|uniref:importin subunit alpha-1-like n=1 Tax=Arctopsyche grandis TaxID=121162 RepID=UPI00406D8D17